ncbi:hypothetical protein HDU96_005867 [Phlyctochytrium bullatum]|nr:hypothetical protein HDU96_005867 [Phlyctochytrium bullatum]
MSDGTSTKSAGYIDLAAEGIISEGSVTTIYSQLIQFVGQLLTAACIYLLLQWHINPKRHAKVTLAERRMVLVGLHGSLVELIDTIFSGLISRHSTLRGHAALLLLFAFVTYAWKVGEILVPSQVKFMVERFTTTVSKAGTPVSVSGTLAGAPDMPSGWSELYSMNAEGSVRAAVTTLQSAGIYAVISANTTFTSPVTRTFSVNPSVYSASDLNDILTKKEGKLAIFVNNATQARLDVELTNRTSLISLDVVVPSILSAYSCELISGSYTPGASEPNVDFNSSWVAVNFTDYRSTQSLTRWNGYGGYGSVQYSIGDGVPPNDYNGDKLNVLRVQAETTPLNLIKDIEGSPNFSSAFKTSFAAVARNTSRADRDGVQPIIPHLLSYRCRGIIQTGRLSLTVSRTAVTLTKFEASSTVNQTTVNRNVLGGYHAFRPVHENLATVQTSCGNTGTRCNGRGGLTSIGDTLGLAVAVEGAYTVSMMAGADGKTVLANTTAAAYEPLTETQDRKFVRVNIFLFVIYVAIAGIPMLAALGLSLISIAAAAMSNKTSLVLTRIWAYENWTGASEMDVDAAIKDRRLGGMDREEVARLAGTHPAEVGVDKKAVAGQAYFPEMAGQAPAPMMPAVGFAPAGPGPADYPPMGGADPSGFAPVGYAPPGPVLDPAQGFAPSEHQWGPEGAYQQPQGAYQQPQDAYQQPHPDAPSQPLAPPPRGASNQTWR